MNLVQAMLLGRCFALPIGVVAFALLVNHLQGVGDDLSDWLVTIVLTTILLVVGLFLLAIFMQVYRSLA